MTRMPLAASVMRVCASQLMIVRQMALPTRRTGGILLSGPMREPSATLASLSSSAAIMGAKNSGSHVPSASRKPTSSPSPSANPVLMAAP